MEAAGKGQHGEGKVGIDGVDRQEAHQGGMRGIVNEPMPSKLSISFRVRWTRGEKRTIET